MNSLRAAAYGIAAVLALWSWQILTVHYNYGGNWTALFCIAPHMPVPPFLRQEKLYIFQGSAGFDGQVFHLIAHDPWLRRGSAEAIVGPAFRYQRILVPALAWCLALGQDPWIHRAYYTVVLAFAFLGVYWMSLLAAGKGLSHAWGLAFLLAPACITSIDRMTADIAMAAFTAGFAFYVGQDSRWKVIAVLTCAALTKEPALPIIGGYTLYLITRKRFIDAVWAGASALPAIAWFFYLSRKLPAEPSALATLFTWIPGGGLVTALLHPVSYPLTPFKNAVGVTFDYVALAGVIIALAFAARLALQRRWDGQTAAIYALAAAPLFFPGGAYWTEAYAFGRTLTPFLLLTAFQSLAERPWLSLLPMMLIDARISLNLLSQVTGVIRGLLQ